jgi:hypothetical protein
VADLAISDLTPLAGVDLAPDDFFEFVDKSDLTAALTGTNKRVTVKDWTRGIGGLTRVVHASSFAAGDATADSSGTYGTDDSAAWQAVMDDAETRGDDLCIVNDVPTLIDTITPAGHVTIRGAIKSPRCGLYRKGRPNGGRTMILNKHAVLGPTAPTDQFIEIPDLYIDGNQRGYGSGNTGTHMAGYDDDTFQHVFNDSGYIVHCIGLYGVRFFRVGNIYIYDSTGYALNLGNCQDGHVHDFRKYNRPGHLVTYDPIIQVQGHCHRIDFDRIGGEARDDALAVNANDGQDDPAATVGPEPGQVAPGPCSDLTFRDCKFDYVMQICRILSASLSNPITNVTFDGVSATIGAPGVPAPGYAGFQIDDFGLTGPLTDGSHGLVDGLKILNVDVNGTNTGAGEGYGSVHMDRCNVKRSEIRNYRYRGYSVQPIAVVHSTDRAKVETLVLDRVVNESILPIAPVLTLKGNHQSVVVDGIEYDMRAAGPDYPQPQFRDTELVRVAGPVVSLAVRNSRGAGLSHLVKCIGFAPANLSVTGSSLLASNGGAAVKSDTMLPSLHIAGVDADHCEDVPAGSMIKSDGSGRYDSRYLRDLFGGAANAVIAGSTATDGSVWQADAAGANQLKASGNGTAFLGGASSFTAAAASAQPPTPSAEALAALMFPSFTVIFSTIRVSSISAGDGIGYTLFATGAGSLADHYWVRFAGASYDLMHNTTVLATSGLIPAVGGTRWLRPAIYAVPGTNDKRITIDYSDDVGRSWANLIPTAYVTTATPALVGLRGVSTAGWTKDTGHHVGSVVVASFNGPIPGLPESPTLVSASFTAADGTNLTAYTPEVGPAAVALSGAWEVNANHARCTTSSPGQCAAVWDVAHADVAVEVTVVTVGADPGVVVRAQDDANYLVMAFGPAVGGIQLYSKVGGAYSPVGAGVFVGIADGDVIKVVTVGSAVYCYLNGTLQVTVTTTQFVNNTKHGFKVNSVNNTVYDDLTIIRQ